MRNAWHILFLGVKELISLARDPVLLFLIAYAFTFAVYTPSKSAVMDLVNASSWAKSRSMTATSSAWAFA